MEMETEDEARRLTPEDIKRRRRRSVALGWFLFMLAVLFFVTTMVRLGGNIASRSF